MPIDASESYEVKLDVFQGPLDLLLFLIRKKKIDIHDIPIAVITREYLEYLNRKERINLDREAEFLLVAALLICIKSQMLLPRERALEEEGDPRQMLVDSLLEHQKIKAASTQLKEKEENELQRWKRAVLPPLVNASEEEAQLREVSLFDLAEQFFLLMKNKENKEIRMIRGRRYSLEEKIKEILELLKENSWFDFLDFFNKQESLEEAFVSFISLLELIKSRIIFAVQENHFQTIQVWLLKEVNPESS
jgi:segregation and condensation protein A